MPGGGALPPPPGAWTLTEPTPDGPKTPERAEILDLLKASAEPLSTGQIAKNLGKQVKTVSALLGRMVQDGDIKMVGYGKYTPVGSVRSVGTSPIIKDEEKKHTTPLLFDMKEGSSPSELLTVRTLLTGVPASAPSPAPQEREASPPVPQASRLPNHCARANVAPESERFRRSDGEPPGRRRYQRRAAPEQSSLYSFMALAQPDAADPYTLQSSGPRRASQSSAGNGRHAGAGVAASRAKTDGETMNG